MIRLGLCCKFLDEPIRFRTTTATALLRLSRADALEKLSALCLENAAALREAVEYCAGHGIGAFRVNSQVLPVKTHPDAGYDVRELPGAAAITAAFRRCGRTARRRGVRLLFHPDQYILLSSSDGEVTRRSMADLEYQAEVAGWIGADVINIHGGGAYGDKPAALARVAANIDRLSPDVRARLTFENDERTYSPRELLPLCRDTGVPLLYDVHHHRCLADGMAVEEATELALGTWNREPVFHVSSPREGWRGPRPSRHHDFVNPRDFPRCWLGLDVTVEVEAKAKEKAVLRLKRWLDRQA
jgi:UV DNA damage endonuclease